MDDEHAMPHINEVKPDKNSGGKRQGYEQVKVPCFISCHVANKRASSTLFSIFQVSSTMERQREKYCALLIKQAWKHHNIDKVNTSAGSRSSHEMVQINGGPHRINHH